METSEACEGNEMTGPPCLSFPPENTLRTRKGKDHAVILRDHYSNNNNNNLGGNWQI